MAAILLSPARPDSPHRPAPRGRSFLRWRTLHQGLLWGVVTVALAACGGGGGGGGSVPPDTLPAEPTSALDANRLAAQASFGANEALVQRITAIGPAAWIQEQMRSDASRYRLGGGADIHQWTNPEVGFCEGRGDSCWRDHYSGAPLLWDFYRHAIEQPDQLRQRVAYALQQILVVSAVEVESTYGLRNYHNLFLEQAFGNYRDLLRRVALSPVMGDFLNQVNNDGAAPNENFARELLQLFSVGTCRLESDGSLSGGSCQPVYDNSTVRHVAYALTGWTYPAGGRTPWGCWPEGANCPYHAGDMLPLPALHDTAQRSLLGGVTLAAGHSPAQALDAVLDSLMQHPNMAPFIGRQLIQHLVTSNPSAAYVQRVAAAFSSGRHASFGSGRKGDLAATVAAILLDAEARDSRRSARLGRLREPVLYFTGVLRALNGQTDGSPLAWWWGEGLQQHLFRPPSVFNFYPPDYPLPGQPQRVAPPFALHNANTALQRLNFLQYLIWWGGSPATDSEAPQPLATLVRLDGFVADAANPARLVDRLATLAQGEPLPAAARAQVIRAVEAFNAESDGDNWPLDRVRQAAYLVFASPHFQIQR